MILEGLQKKSLKAAKKNGFDVIHFDESNQKGASFSQRISNSTQEVFDKGYDQVIIIGNDCPDLSAKDLVRVNKELQINDLVLGPDFRGGVYLIGLNRKSFDLKSFESLSWQTNKLRKSFALYSQCLTKSICWLEAKADFNEEKDIANYWKVSESFRAIYEELKKVIFQLTLLPQQIPSRLVVADFDKRGP